LPGPFTYNGYNGPRIIGIVLLFGMPKKAVPMPGCVVPAPLGTHDPPFALDWPRQAKGKWWAKHGIGTTSFDIEANESGAYKASATGSHAKSTSHDTVCSFIAKWAAVFAAIWTMAKTCRGDSERNDHDNNGEDRQARSDPRATRTIRIRHRGSRKRAYERTKGNRPSILPLIGKTITTTTETTTNTCLLRSYAHSVKSWYDWHWHVCSFGDIVRARTLPCEHNYPVDGKTARDATLCTPDPRATPQGAPFFQREYVHWFRSWYNRQWHVCSFGDIVRAISEISEHTCSGAGKVARDATQSTP
jgi:hypothetical protein